MVQNICNNYIDKLMHSVSEAFFYVDLKRIIDKFSNCNMLERVDYTLIEILVAAEDRRFFTHPGFDIFAILRATFFIFSKKSAVVPVQSSNNL